MNSGKILPPIKPWGTKWTSEMLKREQLTNPRSFALGFQMRAFTDEELTFPSLKSCYTHGVVPDELARRRIPCYVGVDLAGDRRPGNAIVVVGLEPVAQRRVLMKCLYGAWTSPETAGHIADVCANYNVQHILVENNAYQKSLEDWIKHYKGGNPFWMKISGIHTGQNKANPTYGVASIEIEFKNKAWIIPADEFEGHEPGCRCGWCLWTREFSLYPRGSTTDTVMATWFARQAIDNWGGLAQNYGSAIDASFNSR